MSSIKGQYLDQVGEQYNSHYYSLVETYVDYAVIAARLWGSDFMDLFSMNDVIRNMNREIVLALGRITEIDNDKLENIMPDDETLALFNQELRPILRTIESWIDMMDQLPHSLGDGSAE
jgi:hypothetical protein